VINFVSDLRQIDGTPVSSINKTDHLDITEIVLKVALNTIKQTNKQTKKAILEGKKLFRDKKYDLILSNLTRKYLFQLKEIKYSSSTLPLLKLPTYTGQGTIYNLIVQHGDKMAAYVPITTYSRNLGNYVSKYCSCCYLPAVNCNMNT